jgi:plasmid stabilization system protein ParE
MRVIIDEGAWRDFDAIARHIGADNPLAAQAQIDKIRHVIGQLGDFPGLSRDGAARGTRERVVSGTSYIVVFELSTKPSAVIITGVVHGSRRR